MRKPLVIEVGLNEGTTKEENPTVPYSPDEIAKDIIECADAGATIVHFHARDPETGGNRLNDTALYREAITKVRAAGCDVLLYPTYPPYETDLSLRFRHVRELQADKNLGVNIGPLDMGSFNLIQFVGGQFTETSFMPIEASVYANPFLHLQEMLKYYRDAQLIPSLAVFEPGHLRTIIGFLESGLISGVPMIKFFFSDLWLHGLLPDRNGLEAYVHILEASGITEAVEWFCVPYGILSKKTEDILLDATIDLGGHVRVGVGDSPLTSAGRSNAELVADIVVRAKDKGRVPATTADVLNLVTY